MARARDGSRPIPASQTRGALATTNYERDNAGAVGHLVSRVDDYVIPFPQSGYHFSLNTIASANLNCAQVSPARFDQEGLPLSPALKERACRDPKRVRNFANHDPSFDTIVVTKGLAPVKGVGEIRNDVYPLLLHTQSRDFRKRRRLDQPHPGIERFHSAPLLKDHPRPRSNRDAIA